MPFPVVMPFAPFLPYAPARPPGTVVPWVLPGVVVWPAPRLRLARALGFAVSSVPPVPSVLPVPPF